MLELQNNQPTLISLVQKREEAIRLRVEGQESVQNIAGKVGVPVSTVRSWLKNYPIVQGIRPDRNDSLGDWVKPSNQRGVESHLYRLAVESGVTTGMLMDIARQAVLMRLAVLGAQPVGVLAWDSTPLMHVWLPQTGRTVSVYAASVYEQKNSPQPMCRVGRRVDDGVAHKTADFVCGYDLYTDKVYVWAKEELSNIKYAVTVNVNSAERWDKIRGASLEPVEEGEDDGA